MKIICIGKNYVKHIQELNGSFDDNPTIFMKPDSSIIQKNQPFFIPDFSDEIHYELELILKFSKVGKHIDKDFCLNYISHFSLGIDFTARDLQNDLKLKGLPWEISKSFDNSALIGEWIPYDDKIDLNNINFSLKKNGKIVQKSNSSKMIWKITELIHYASKYFTIKIGDIMFTGTPEGVGKVKIGDFLEGFIDKEKIFEIKIK